MVNYKPTLLFNLGIYGAVTSVIYANPFSNNSNLLVIVGSALIGFGIGFVTYNLTNKVLSKRKSEKSVLSNRMISVFVHIVPCEIINILIVLFLMFVDKTIFERFTGPNGIEDALIRTHFPIAFMLIYIGNK